MVVTLRSSVKLDKMNSVGSDTDKDRFSVVIETSSSTNAKVMIGQCGSNLQGIICTVSKSGNQFSFVL